MPALSIIVPIYNVEKYLPTCIESILAQTFTNFELILVNDGSPDKCDEICDKYNKKDTRIRVIHKENGGVSSARNAGINIAKGDYFAFVDPDDAIEPDMYHTLIQTALKYTADIVICPIKTINLINNEVSISTIWKRGDSPLSRDDIKKYLIPSILINKTYSLVSSVNKIYNRRLFSSSNIRFDERKSHSEDVRLNFFLLTQINNLVYVNQPLYNYFIRDRESLTRVFREDFYDYILDNKNFMINLCKCYKLEVYKGLIQKHFTGLTLSYIESLIKKKLSTNRRNEILENILNDNEFLNDLKQYECPSTFYKLMKISCLKKNIKNLIIIVKIKSKIRYYLNR